MANNCSNYFRFLVCHFYKIKEKIKKQKNFLLLASNSNKTCFIFIPMTPENKEGKINDLFTHQDLILKENIKKEHLDVVFSSRQKIGFYEKIDRSTIKILEEAFKNVFYCYFLFCKTLISNSFHFFFKSPYPSKKDLKEISEKSKISQEKVYNWFKGQRKKDFLTHKKVIKNYKVYKFQMFFCVFFVLKKRHTFSGRERRLLEKSFRRDNVLSHEKLKEL